MTSLLDHIAMHRAAPDPLTAARADAEVQRAIAYGERERVVAEVLEIIPNVPGLPPFCRGELMTRVKLLLKTSN